MSHTQSPDSPTLDEDYEEEIPMDESASPDVTEVRVLTRAQRKAIAAANRAERTADVKARQVASGWTYLTAIVSTILAVLGMYLFWHEVVGMPLWVAVFLSGFLEMTLVASALWDRVAAMRGRTTRATATWLVAATSGFLAAIHEVAVPMPGGGSEWNFEPFNLLAAAARILPPLAAAWLWHKLLVEAGHEAEGRTMSQVRRAKRMHRYARLAHTQGQIEKQIERERKRQNPDEKRLTRLHNEHGKVEAAVRKAYDRVLHVMPGTDPRLPLELDQWARAIAAGDTMVAMTDARIEGDVQTAAAVMTVPTRTPARRRTAPAPRPPEPQRTQVAPAREETPRAPSTAPAAAPSSPETAGGAHDGQTEQERVLALFAEEVRANPFEKPNAVKLHEEAGVTASRASSRRWVNQAWVAHEAEQAALGSSSERRDAAQLEAEVEPKQEGLRVVG